MADGDNGAGGTGEGGTPWDSAGLSEEQQGYVTNKGWENPAGMLTSYQQLEGHVGVPADRLLKLPSQDADPKEWDSVWAKLGRPENADGYGDFKLPEGATPDDGRTKAFKDFAHGLGLSTNQANAIAGWDAQYLMDAGKTQNDENTAKLETELNALRTNWGAAFDQNMLRADRAAAEFGLAPEDVQAMQGTWGRAKTAQFLANVGAKMGEHTFERGEGRNFETMSPGEASAKIAELRNDQAFMHRYLAGEKESLKRMNDLYALRAAKG